MDISSLVKTGLQIAQLNQAASPTQGSGISASQLTAAGAKRLSQQLESTNVQLSAYGQIKNAFGSAQTASSGLTSAATSKTATNADIEKAAQAFVSAYNQAAQAVSGATTKSSSQSGALASDLRAKSAGTDLARSITGGSGPANLKQAGITLNKNGTLSLDTKALQQALQSNPSATKTALASLGQQVSATAQRELSSTGNVGVSVGRLTSRAQTLGAQQTALEQQTTKLQATLETQNATLNYVTANGLAAYRRMLG